MKIVLERNGTEKDLFTVLDQMTNTDTVKGVLVLACSGNGFSPDRVNHYLKNYPKPLFGGIFPAVIYGSEKLDQGTIVVGLSMAPLVQQLDHLSDPAVDFDRALEAWAPKSKNAKTLFMFVDGYASGIMALIDAVYDYFGMGVTYLGGGAGAINPLALEMNSQPCLFSNKGMLKDAALLALVDIASGVGVGHGWHKISGPYKVTKARGNVIETLDSRPAFQVYREMIKEHAGEIITPENFFDVAKRYPFGISRLESEVIVRDPFTVNGEHLVIAAGVPHESFIDILTGNPDSLVAAAQTSMNTAKKNFTGISPYTVFAIDCISRALFLGADFNREIAALTLKASQLIGVLSLGEIANCGEDYMELYNKTCVVGILGE